MASTTLRQDSCSYEEKLKTSVGPGMYMLGSPANDYESCSRDVPSDPYVRWQAWGPGFCEPGSVVDVGSELMGLNYKATKCAEKQYSPYNDLSKALKQCKASGKTDPRACMAPTENTRLSNPPCTLKGTGWNRWEWLCYNPQDTAIMPFDANINYRIIAKDNHKPCLPAVQDQTNEVGRPIAAIAASASVPGAPGDFSKWKPLPNTGAEAPGNPFDKYATSCQNMSVMGA